MTRKIFLLGPLLLSACATPDLPGGFGDEQSWFDARVEERASAQSAPAFIPVKTPSISAGQLRQSVEEVLEARDALLAAERATGDTGGDTESFADEARQRVESPQPNN